MAEANRKLPKKEADSFRSLVKFYETKQYKKGLKAADSILKKFPNHGETLAMKGLVVSNLDRKEEAYELVKAGLKNDLRSHVCWHVFGLLHRADRNYNEAIKCYLNALRIDPDNQQIMRDLSFLQIHMRDLAGFIETRRQLLVQKSNNKQHWVAYAVGNYVAGNHARAREVLDAFLKTQDGATRPNYEDSELELFKNQCIEGTGNYAEALEHLDANAAKIVDVLGAKTKKAEYLLLLGRHSEAEQLYLELLERQSENYRYHCGYQSAVLQFSEDVVKQMLKLKACDLPSTVLDLSEQQRSALVDKYRNELRSRFRSSRAVVRILLTLLSGDDFNAALDEYMRKQLRAGVPSLGSDLDALYVVADPRNSAKYIRALDFADVQNNVTAQLVLSKVREFIAALEANKRFPNSETEEDPSALLWCYYLEAHVLERMGQLPEALAAINKGIAHTATAVDFYQKKARILKKCGDLAAAASTVDGGRRLDLADRYINNKTTKYLLRANRIDEANDTIALFTRHEGDPQWNLFEMQVMWYELEAGEAYWRKQQYGPALKKFFAVEKHFNDFIEDQFDFHAYCMRKVTVRAYIDLLKVEDRMYAHKNFLRAARNAIRIYLHLADHPRTEQAEATEDMSNLSEEEKKKLKQKLKKEKKKAEKAEKAEKAKEQEEQQSKTDDEDSKKKGGRTPPLDDDPKGEKLATKDPIPEAVRLAKIVEEFGAEDAEAQLAVYDVRMRTGQYLPALRALRRALQSSNELDAANAFAKWRLAGFLHQMRAPEFASKMSSTALDALRTVVGELAQSCDLDAFVSQFIAQAGSATLAHKAVAVRLAATYGPAAQKNQLADDLANNQQCRGRQMPNVLRVLEFLGEDSQLADVQARLREAYAQRYPLANAFGGGLAGDATKGPVSLTSEGEAHFQEPDSSPQTAETA